MSDTETITITLKEYKELLIIKGKYEELKEQQQQQQIPCVPWNTHITYKTADDWLEKETKPYKVTCDLAQHDCDGYGNKPQIELNNFPA